MTKNKKCISVLIFVFAIFVMLICTAITASAFSQYLKIKILNPPQGKYCIALLTQYSGDEEFQSPVSDSAYADSDMVRRIEDYSEDGWRLQPRGTIYVSDNLTNSEQRYSYDANGGIDVPREFRIIIAEEKGDVTVSETVERKSDILSVNYDYENNKVKQNYTSAIMKIMIMFIVTCIAVIIIERIIFGLFKLDINLEYNGRCFYLTNIVTHIFTYLCLFLPPYGIGIKVFAPQGAVVIIAEVLVYRKFLKGAEKSKIAAYAITANIISFILFIPIVFGLSLILSSVY